MQLHVLQKIKKKSKAGGSKSSHDLLDDHTLSTLPAVDVNTIKTKKKSDKRKQDKVVVLFYDFGVTYIVFMLVAITAVFTTKAMIIITVIFESIHVVSLTVRYINENYDTPLFRNLVSRSRRVTNN